MNAKERIRMYVITFDVTISSEYRHESKVFFFGALEEAQLCADGLLGEFWPRETFVEAGVAWDRHYQKSAVIASIDPFDCVAAMTPNGTSYFSVDCRFGCSL